MLPGVAYGDVLSPPDGARCPGASRRHEAPSPRVARLIALAMLSALLALAIFVLIPSTASADRVYHAPISIIGDENFTAANGVASGTGTQADPYIISGWAISPGAWGILIKDTTEAFVVRDVGVLGHGQFYGIELFNTTGGSVENCTVDDTANGVYLDSSSLAMLANLTITNSSTTGLTIEGSTTVIVVNIMVRGAQTGIRMYLSQSCQLDRCVALDCTKEGIRVEGDVTTVATKIEMKGCNASDDQWGIRLVGCKRCEVSGCTASDNKAYDISLLSSERITLATTRMGKGGLFIDSNFQLQDIQDTNTVDGRPLRYLKYVDGGGVEGDTGQLFLVLCRNVTFANRTFDGVVVPVYLYESRRCTVLNCTFIDPYIAVWLDGGGPNDVANVTVERETPGVLMVEGINVVDGDANVTGSHISGPTYGIFAEGGMTVNVVNCTVGNCGYYGIYVVPTTFQGDVRNKGELTVDGCVLHNTSYGVLTENMELTVRGTAFDDISWYGVQGVCQSGTVVDGCRFSRCQMGLFLEYCPQVTVSSNVLDHAYASGGTGICLRWYCPGTIEGNNVTGYMIGIDVEGDDGVQLSNDELNLCTYKPYYGRGIYIEDSPHCTLTGCSVFDSDTGIELDYLSDFASVLQCLVVNCSNGILVSSSDSLVKECTIKGCSGFGIEFDSCSNSIAYHDNLLYNNYNRTTGKYSGAQATDETTENEWDDGTEGNYWSDYTTRFPDAKANGRVWDTPYPVDTLYGDGTGVDRHPLTLLVDLEPPVADAGPDVTVGEGTNVTLDGSRSTDDVGVVTYRWSLVYAGLPVHLAGRVAGYTFGRLGTYVVTLWVADAWGNSAVDTMVVRVVDMVPPVAVAGADVTVDVYENVALDGRGSYDDHGIVSYNWTIDPGGINYTSPQPVLVTSFSRVGDYVAVLNVTDAFGNWATDSLVVHVRDLTPPTADAGPDIDVGQGAIVTFDGSASSDVVGIARWNWTFEYGGELIALEGRWANFTFDVPGNYSVTLTVWDAGGLWSRDVVLVRIRDTEPPVADAGRDLVADQGRPVTLDGTASHDNVGIIGYSWSTVVEGEETWLKDARPSIVFLEAGDYNVTLNVTDAAGNWATDAMTVHVSDRTAPVADAGPDETVNEHTRVHFDGSNSADDVGVVSYRWTLVYAGAPVTFSGPTWSFTFDIAGTYYVNLTVADAARNAGSDVLTVKVVDTDPPVAVSGGDRTAVEGSEVNLDASGSHDNVGIVLYRWTVVGSVGNRTYLGPVQTVKLDETGDLRVELRVEDAAGNAAVDDLIVTVLPLWVMWRLGPLTDTDAVPIAGVHVRVVLNGTEYSGETDRTGFVELQVRRYDLVSPAGVNATKGGYEPLKTSMKLDELGRPTDGLPAMSRTPVLGIGTGSLIALLVVILILVLVSGMAVVRAMRRKRSGGSA